MIDNILNKLLKDVKVDKNRVTKSINTILSRYNLNEEDVTIYRKKLKPSEIFVVAVEECNLKTARKLAKGKYADIFPAPITILEFKGKYILFMGSNRSIVFVLKKRMPDCVIITIPNIKLTPIIVSEARQTLEQVIEAQQ